MGDRDPVQWETIEAALGPPAAEIQRAVNQHRTDLDSLDAYTAVKTVHDAIDNSEKERSVPSAAEPFMTAYLLEQAGVIGDDNSEYKSIADRRPD